MINIKSNNSRIRVNYPGTIMFVWVCRLLFKNNVNISNFHACLNIVYAKLDYNRNQLETILSLKVSVLNHCIYQRILLDSCKSDFRELQSRPFDLFRAL